MIVTVTLNPSVDRTIALPGPLARGGVLRVADAVDEPGGKGINISRACAAAGLATRAVLPTADASFLGDLADLGIACAAVPAPGRMRVNLTLTEPDGTTTKLNAAGAPLPADLLAALAERVLDESGDWFVLAGSLPPGVPDGWYAELTARLRGRGRRVAVDTSDAALSAVVAGLAAGTAPSLLKPNADELAAVVGAAPGSLEGDPTLAAAAARTLVERGAGAVLATLGAAGAVLVDGEGAWHATPPPVRVVSTVGAGDSSLFGYLAADLRGASGPERLASAVAYGSAAAALPGSTVPSPADARVHEIRVLPLDVPSSTTASEGVPSWQN
ncbi:1-phosphofructokinase family hexose kinase [Nocardioides nitrophenolicus]|uniref:1-phosphofructokinase family hexose kinase n=1 Tax=Nocardioides nitrophenolicus TaxID=60489 RepID=UPI001959B85F|nr:hexose kinase [Nocardioides nitrophenolicus]MBM7518538.1 1-phosphofructokinase [Nocardioides nitrophenolicus]